MQSFVYPCNLYLPGDPNRLEQDNLTNTKCSPNGMIGWDDDLDHQQYYKYLYEFSFGIH